MILAADEVRPVEDRAQVAALGDLQARRRTLLATLAPLKALHGHGGLYDDKRKQLLEACKIRARMTLTDAGQKITEGMVDAMAYADEQYAAFIDSGITARIDYLTLANELTEIEEQIRDRELCLLVYNSEVKLDR
jgi:hypothetical protein